MKVVLLLLSVIGVSICHPLDEALNNPSWKNWKIQHGKVYKSVKEERVRNFVWQDNLKKIIRHNEERKLGYKLAMNHLGDMTEEEVRSVFNGFKDFKSKNLKPSGSEPAKTSTFLTPSNLEIPEAVDWRKEGYVTPVKNQKHCGSCWSFSATGALEGQHFKKTGKLVSLSEQNLVDCSISFGNNGCHGGLMDNAFRYIKANKGIDTEASYPYKAEVGKCHFNVSMVGATDTGFADIPHEDEQALKAALASVGPISVAIDASHSTFHFYHEGVYDDPACSPVNLDHGVLAVGYGTEDGQDYWLIKNSWGTVWGDQGYIKIARKNNLCGVATQASYPLV